MWMGVHQLWIWLMISGLAAVVSSCPSSCLCKDCYPDVDDWSESECKVVCESQSPALSLTDVPRDIPGHVIQIDLSGNALTRVSRSSFGGLTSLQKLDLSSNHIKTIEPRAFSGLTNLLKLDLSGNGLKTVNASLFEGLPNLLKLELAGNELTTIPEGTFDVLPSLVKVDFQSRRLVCDCRLQWVVKWQKTKNVRIRDSTTCAEPPEHRGKSLKELKKKQFTCDEEVELPYFDLSPSVSQVVFEGDHLPFECRASVPNMDAHMMWVRGGHQVTNNHSQGVSIHQTYSPDNSILMQSLILERLLVSHSGVWTCFIQTARGNASKSVNIIVMSLQTSYCPSVTNITTKGTYSWPKTVSGVKMSLACEKGPASWYKGDVVAMATHRCSVEGRWERLDTDQCAYSSEVTRVLEQYSTVEMTNSSNVMSYMDKLLHQVKDKMDVVYIARIMASVSKQVKDNQQVADFLLETASTLLTVDGELLRGAQAQDGSCSKVVKVLDSLPKELLWEAQYVQKHTRNIAMAAHQVTSDGFEGMTCSVYREKGVTDPMLDVYVEDSLVCVEGGNSTEQDVQPRKGMELEASIHIPADIFRNVRCLYPLCSQSDFFHLQFIVYKNAKLFPVLHSQNIELETEQEVITSVISANIAGVSVDNTSSPIITKLRLPDKLTNHRAVYWDFLANEGRGSWLSRGCSIVEQEASVATIHCNHLTHFGISQDSSVIRTPFSSAESVFVWLSRLFTMSPIMYAGSIILTACCMAVLITYISGHRFLKMPRKYKHAVANVCLCLLLLCVTFTLGIRIHEPIAACQVVGLIIHYLSLAELFWIIILASTMFKKFMKAFQPPPPPIEPLEEPPAPRSAVTCYLIGWGIPIIICGISGAIYWKEYSGSGDFCFLSLNSALLTFFGPSVLVLIVILVFFLRSCCILRRPLPLQPPPVDENETEEIHLAEDDTDGATEELITTVGAAGTIEGRESRTGESQTTTPTNLSRSTMTASKMDLVRRPSSQLHGMVILLLLYLVTWASGAMAITLPLEAYIPYQSVIFSYLYGLSSTGLGVYILVFYCISRADCRRAWSLCCVYPPQKIEIEETPPPMSMQQINHIRTNGRVQSTTSLSSAHTNHSNTISSFNPGLYGLQKPSKMNLLQSSATEQSHTGSQDQQNVMFYNPRQNGVAKKYWEKKNHRKIFAQMSKEMNADSGHSSNTDGRGGMIYNNGKRLSYQGHSSDGNTYKSLEIQIPPKNGIILDPRIGGQSPSNAEFLQNVYNSLSRRNQQGHHSPITIDPVTGAPIMCVPIDRRGMGGLAMPYHPINYSSSLEHSAQLHSPPGMPTLGDGSYLIPGKSGASSVVSGPNNSAAGLSPSQYMLSPVPPNGMYNATQPAGQSPRGPVTQPAFSAVRSANHVPSIPVNHMPHTATNHMPHTPVNHIPHTPVNHMPHTPVNHMPHTPVNHMPHTPVNHMPHTPVNHMPHTPVNHMPHTPVNHMPHTPVNHMPHTPVNHMPHTPVNHMPLVNGSVPRLRDFDGQSFTSHDRASHCESNQDSSRPVTCHNDKSPTQQMTVDLREEPPMDDSECVKANPHANKARSPLAVESESDVFSDTDPFLKEIKQRIPQNCVSKTERLAPQCAKGVPNGTSDASSKSKSPTPNREMNGFTSSDGCADASPCAVSRSSQEGKGSGADSHQSKTSGTQSEPLRKGCQHPKTNRSQSLPKGGCRDWENEFSNKPQNKSAYAFVNHDYRDRVLHKLIKQNQDSGSSLVDSGVSWLPRSVSAYDQVITTETDTLVEETGSSSSDDSEDYDDIWIMQHGHRKKKLSQETSV